MLVACWSAKGGSGTTVVSVALATMLARSAPAGALLADLAGDVPAVLGRPEPDGPGLYEWLAAGDGVPVDALARLEVEAGDRLRLLPAGSPAGAAGEGRGEVLAALLGADRRPVVVDCGCLPTGAALSVAAASASLSLLVLRPCYLSLRRALTAPLRPSGVVLVAEPGRALGRDDVEEVLGVPVRAVVAVDPHVARAVDAGVFPGRLPRSLERALRMSRDPISSVDAGALAERIHLRLLEGAEGAPSGGALRRALERLALGEAPLLDEATLAEAVDRAAARVEGLGPLEPLLADPTVTEVMVNGPGPVWVERDGRLERLDLELDVALIGLLIERVVAPLGLRIDRSSPLVDARLADGSRVNAIVPPLAIDGPCLTIRRFGSRRVSLDEACPPGVAALLGWAVRARSNIVVSGGTGAGKTTLLNALAGEIPAGERVVTVEDAAELRLPGDHVVRLESRPPNAEGAGAVGVRELVRNALRMRPDRIVVGEVRGPEALDMLQAMNTGHEGSLSTCHANGPADALRRIETMVLSGSVALPLAAVREQVVAAVDLVVQVARRADGSRWVVEVAEVEIGSGDAPRLTRLATAEGVVALPTRTPRSSEAGPPAAGVGGAAVSAGLLPGLLVLAALLAAWGARRAGGRARARARFPTTTAVAPAVWSLQPPSWLVARIRSADLGVEPGPAVGGWLVAVVLGVAVSLALGGAGLALVVAVLATGGPYLALGAAGGRADRRLEAALPEALEAVARSLRAGASLGGALAEAGGATPGRLGDALGEVVATTGAGVSLADALDRWAARVPLPGVRLGVAALALAAETGGAGARAIDGVAETVRERLAVTAEVRALSAQARLSALVIILAPLAFSALAVASDEGTANFLFRTPAGLACLVAGLSLDAVAALWMQRLARVEP